MSRKSERYRFVVVQKTLVGTTPTSKLVRCNWLCYWQFCVIRGCIFSLIFSTVVPKAYLRQAAQPRCDPKCSHPRVNISRRALRVLDQVCIVPQVHLRQAAQPRCGPKCSHPRVNTSRRALRVLDQVCIVPQVCSPV